MKKLTSTLATLIVALTLSGCEQAHVDAQMEELCKQDGGMKIHETAMLPKEQFKYGAPVFFGPWSTSGTSGGGYKVVRKYEEIKVMKPSLDIITWNSANLTKTSYTVIREADNKILGTYVYYQRIGGAIMPRLGPDPSKNCPSDARESAFFGAIFLPIE